MPRTYVDNAQNRRIGRVGMPVGSMVVSSSSGGGGGSYCANSYVDNAQNRRIGRVGMPVGSMVVSSSNGGGGGSYCANTYVDNAQNRRIGRAGMPLGSMVVSKSLPGGGDGLYCSGTTSYRPDHGLDSRRYSSPDTTKTYVGNAYNRRHDRVGLEHGTAVVHKASPPTPRTEPTNVYVDNPYNRRHNRAGKELGTAVITKQGRASPKPKGGAGEVERTPDTRNMKLYKDNAFNRRVGRAGQPVGTAVYDRESGTFSYKEYTDSPLNRKLQRLGLPKGSMPSPRKCDVTRAIRDLVQQASRQTPTTTRGVQKERADTRGRRLQVAKRLEFRNSGDEEEEDRDYSSETRYEDYEEYRSLPSQPDGDENEYEPEPYGDDFDLAFEHAQNHLNRLAEEMEWTSKEKQGIALKTSDKVIADYSGVEIAYEDLEMHRKIGQGGFGEVYFAKWKGSVVAVKKLCVNKIAKRRAEEFVDEVMRFCNLDHENIVKFIGACVEQPNLCIVMEYMQMSLFDALHVDDNIEFSEEERLAIIRQACRGLQYLHANEMAHCDVKSQNILLDYQPDAVCTAKITDFGFSMVKSSMETSSTGGAERACNIGTPRYSAPEILRGEMLSAKDMMRADVYSMALVAYEVIYEEEPFYDLSYAQLQKQVGSEGLTPGIVDDANVQPAIVANLFDAWDKQAKKRPNIFGFHKVFKRTNLLYNP